MGESEEDREGALAPPQMSVDARRLAARCVKSIPLHLTPRPSYSFCDIEEEEGGHFSSD